jgi:hypothetical protein
MIDKPSEKEEEYFKQKELELLKKFEKEREAYRQAEEKERIQKLHYMKCPKCYGDLKEENYKNKVNIDKCQQCGGVWLDCGELETLAAHEEGFLSGFLKHLTS